MKTPISYYGGKQTMLRHILPLIPPHRLYTEAFCGEASVLFAKRPAACEVVNDLNRGLVNFCLVAKKHYSLLKDEIDATLHCRDQHAHTMHINAYPEFFSPAQWAWAVWTLSKLSFASMQDGTFGYDRAGTTALKVKNATYEFTELLCARLRDVTIENDDALKILARYDTQEAFDFVDPPYVNSDMRSLRRYVLRRRHVGADRTVGAATRQIHAHDVPLRGHRDGRRKQEEWMVCNYTPTEANGQTKLDGMGYEQHKNTPSYHNDTERVD